MNLWLTLHIVGVVLFVGNIVTAAFWKVRADLGGNPVVVHDAAKSVMLADFVFTLPGIVLVTASGVAMAHKAGMPMDESNWLTVSLAVFGATGLIWGAVLIPLQRAMIRHSAASVAGGSLTAEYRRASRLWAVFGAAATLLPIAVLALMIAKPF
ncbi:DUF2269 family protein [Cohnella hongkongensis]|uniref:DUF2269 family protein n=1 Tax=Cohnella hongkongensis TaxID=178337 RepID=A0ABV9F7H8_9BACL